MIPHGKDDSLCPLYHLGFELLTTAGMKRINNRGIRILPQCHIPGILLCQLLIHGIMIDLGLLSRSPFHPGCGIILNDLEIHFVQETGIIVRDPPLDPHGSQTDGNSAGIIALQRDRHLLKIL